MAEKGYYLDFMYDKISVSTMVMVNLLKSPEFVSMIEKKIDEGISIDNKTVYQVLENVYFPAKYNRDMLGVKHSGSYLNHEKVRKALRELSEVLYKDAEHWRVDYLEYIKSKLT